MRTCFVIFLLSLSCPPISVPAHTDAGQHFAYIQALYARHDRHLYDLIVRELEEFIDRYPEADSVVTAQYLLGAVYEEKGDRNAALIAYLKAALVYPEATRRTAAVAAIRRLSASERSLRDVATNIMEKVDSGAVDSTEAGRVFEVLQFCRRLGIDKLNKPLLREAERFAERYPAYPHLDLVLQLIGDLYREEGKETQAAAVFLKLEFLTPGSAVLPYVRYQRATLHYRELDSPEEAIRLFSQVARESPQSPYAADALFYIGEIKEKKLGDYAGAILEYRQMVDTYPAAEKSVEALWRVAQIYIKRLQNYAAGIATYTAILEKYPDNERAPRAIEEAAEVYRKKLADYDAAAALLADFAEKFPQAEQAPEFLFKAAEIMRKDKKDPAKAIAYYTGMSEKFASHRLAKKAQRESEKLKREIEKQQ